MCVFCFFVFCGEGDGICARIYSSALKTRCLAILREEMEKNKIHGIGKDIHMPVAGGHSGNKIKELNIHEFARRIFHVGAYVMRINVIG